MAATIITIDRNEPERSFAQCRVVIKAGGVLAYPTDTFYGLGADPRDAAAIRRIFAMKERNADQPVLLLLADPEEVEQWTPPLTSKARLLMERYWPGPLTLVLPAREDVLPELTAGTGTIGIRIPGNAETRALLRYLGTALTGTSANRSGGPQPRTAREVDAVLGSELDLILDGGPASSGLPSTIVDMSGTTPRIIRRGILDIELCS